MLMVAPVTSNLGALRFAFSVRLFFDQQHQALEDFAERRVRGNHFKYPALSRAKGFFIFMSLQESAGQVFGSCGSEFDLLSRYFGLI